MSFKLHIEFSGLCNYLVVKQSNEVGVVMPDGRQHGCLVKPYDWDACHKHLVPHVGYLRYNLADTRAHVPGTSSNHTPEYEVVHRFDFENLDLGLDEPDEHYHEKDETDDLLASGMGLNHLLAADVEGFDPCAKPRPGLYGPRPPKRLLMRTVLRGGEFQKPPHQGYWYFDATLHPSGVQYQTWLSGVAIWSRTIHRTHLKLRLSSWRHPEQEPTVVRLWPTENNTVSLKIANLCAHNPLEWPELPPRIFDATADEDFKWFYFLWEDDRGDFGGLCGGHRPRSLPVPHPHPIRGEVWNCGNAQMAVDAL